MNDDQRKHVTKERALFVLETYGADPARWPEEGRDELLRVVKQDAELSKRMQEEGALDAVLRQASAEPPSLALQSRILSLRGGEEGVGGTSATRQVWNQIFNILWPFGSAAIPAGALVMALVLGGTTGFITSTANNGLSDEGTYDVVALALGDTTLSEEWQ